MIKKLLFSVITIMFVFASLGTKAQNNANILTHNIHYYSYDQDMWGPGDAFNLDFDYELFNLQFNENPSIDFITDIPLVGPVGIAWEAGFWAYLSSTFSMHGFTLGSIDIDYPVTITLDFPNHYSFDHGETILVETSYQVQNGWRLDSHFPETGVIALDLEYGFGVYMNIVVCVFDCETIPILPTLSIPINPQYNDPLPHDSIAILYLNGETGEVAYPCMDELTGLPTICNDDVLPIIIPDFFDIGLTGEIDIPYVETEDALDPNTQCLTAHGSDPWLSLELDILQFLSFIAGFIPAPEGPAIQEVVDIISGGVIEMELMPDVNIIIDYYLLQISLNMVSHLTQDLAFCPEIWVTLGFPTELPYSVLNPNAGNAVVDNGVAQDITFQVNNNLEITYPCYEYDSMPVSVAYHFVPLFTNHTWDSVAFDFLLSVFYVHVTIPFDLFSPGVMPEFELPEIEYMTEVGYRQELSYASPEITIISPPQIELSTTQSSFDIAKSEERDDGENGDYDDTGNYQMKDFEFEFGPLLEESFPIGYFEFTWFNETWEMDGFLLDTVIPGIATYLYPRPYLDMSIDAQDVLCFGDTTGVVTVTAIHSSGPFTYTYSWGSENTHMGPSDHIIVPAGYYYATITDVYGCSVNDEINVADENPPLALNLYSDDVLCAGEPTGNLYSFPSGGVPPYTFDWQPSGSTEQNPEGVYAGWHHVTVTDNVGCTIDGSVFIDEPAEPLTMAWEYTNVSCYGFTDAHINITVTGGTPPYFYSWSNNVMIEDLYNIGEGSYSVTVMDSHGCDIEHTFVIIQPTELAINLDIQNILCYGDNTGYVTSSVTGGTPPYTYTWSNGETTPSINNLYAGIYELSVTDAHGCEIFAIARVQQPDLPLSLYIEPTDVRCFAEANGIADLTAIGGTPPYYYYWSNGEISEDLYDLEPGLYSVTVFDEHDCVAYAQTQIYQPVAPLSGTIDGTNVICNGNSDGNVYIDVSGGVPPYHYNWSNGSWSEDQFNITAGNYSVTITDANYCHYTMSYEITEPAPWTIEIIDNPTVCAGQNATVGLNLVTGNTPPYVIMWDNGSTGMTTNVPTSVFDSISSWTVTAIAIDANNCMSNPIPITVNVLEPLNLEVTASKDSVCPGEYVSFDIEITGGGIAGNQIYVNDTLHYLPVGFQIFNDTVFEFVVYDSCHFKHKRIVKAIKTLPLPPIYVVADKTDGCAPLSVLFRETSPNIGQTYLWNFDDGDFENLSLDKYPVHTFFNSTTYHVNLEVTGANGCSIDTTIGIVVYPIPRAEFRASATKVHMVSPAVTFTNYTEGGFYFKWDFGDGAGSTETNPQHKFSFPGVYHVLMTTESLYECVDSTGVDITVSDETLIYAPTAFTPNDDQINDAFRVVGEGIDKLTFKMEIYNRWGERIFETDDYEAGWNGMDQKNRRMPQGVYTWTIYFKDPFGNLHTKTGQVTLLK